MNKKEVYDILHNYILFGVDAPALDREWMLELLEKIQKNEEKKYVIKL